MKYYPPTHIVFGLSKEVGEGPPDARLDSTAAMEIAVKYRGFATPPLQKQKKQLQENIEDRNRYNMHISAGLHAPAHIHRCPAMHDWQRFDFPVFYSTVYKPDDFSWNISRCGGGRDPPLNWNISVWTPPTSLKRGAYTHLHLFSSHFSPSSYAQRVYGYVHN